MCVPSARAQEVTCARDTIYSGHVALQNILSVPTPPYPSYIHCIIIMVIRVTITTGVLAALLSVTPSLPQWAISMCLVVDLCRGRRSYRCLCSRRWFSCSSTLQTNLCSHTSEKPLVSVGGEYTVHVFCLECGVSRVRIPPEAAHFCLENLHYIHDVV